MPPPQYMTREGTEILVMKALKEYEEEIVQPRHEQNLSLLRKIEKVIYIGYGVVITMLFIIKLVWK